MAISAKYFITDQRGNYIDWSAHISGFSLLGKEVQLNGGAGDDALYVQAGTSADITNMGGGINTLYLTGGLADYTQTIDQQTGVYTFIRTAGLAGGQSEVVKLTVADKNDVVYFADGHLTINAVTDPRLFDVGTATYQVIQSGWLTAGGSPVSPVTTAATQAVTPAKVFIEDAQGLDVPALMQPGQAMEITGSGAVDTVYINAGTSVDASNLGGGNDRLYLLGSLAEYTQTIDQQTGVYTLTRNAGGQNEMVKFTVGDQNDVVYFADGYITINAVTDTRLFDVGTTTYQTIQGAWLTSSSAIVDTAFNLLQGGWGVLPSITPGVAVEVTGAITVAELALIDAANGWGSLIYTSLADTQANLSSSSYVKPGANVTVTDVATIAQLTVLDAANGTSSVTTVSVTDAATNLVSGGVVSAFITPGVAVNVTDAIPLADLSAIDTANAGGTLSYVAVSGTLSQINANMGAGGYLDPNSVVGVTFTVTDTVSMAGLRALEIASGVAPVATSIADTAANLSDFSQYITPGVNVTVTDALTVAALAVLDSLNGAGTLTYSLADTQANLSTSSYVNAGVAVTVTDVATISQLNAFDAANVAAGVTATSVADTAANLAPGGVVSAYIASGVAVNVLDTISLTSLAAIDTANVAGVLTYAGVSGTRAQIAASSYVGGGVAVTVTDAVSLAELSGIQGVTGVQPVATSIVDMAGNLVPGGVASAYIANGVGVTVTDAISIDDLVLIDTANGAAGVTANAINDVAAKLVTGGVASPYIGAGVAVGVTDTISTADLAAIDTANVAGALTYAGIIGTLSQVTPYVASGVTVTVTDTVTVQDLIDIQAISGVKPVASSIADTAAVLIQDGLGGSTHFVGDGVVVTVTDSISVADLATIDATNVSAGVTVSSITDTSAQLSVARATYNLDGVALTVTDAITLSDFAVLDVANGAASLTLGATASLTGTAGAADVLQLSNSLSTINLGAFNQSGQPLLSGFEIFDMSADSGANAVTLTAAGLFLQSSNFTDALTGHQTLVVNGGSNDQVYQPVGGDWALQGTANSFDATGAAGTGYSQYFVTYTGTGSVMEVLVQNGVVVL